LGWGGGIKTEPFTAVLFVRALLLLTKKNPVYETSV
jgi:hypothetical protein